MPDGRPEKPERDLNMTRKDSGTTRQKSGKLSEKHGNHLATNDEATESLPEQLMQLVVWLNVRRNLSVDCLCVEHSAKIFER